MPGLSAGPTRSACSPCDDVAGHPKILSLSLTCRWGPSQHRRKLGRSRPFPRSRAHVNATPSSHGQKAALGKRQPVRSLARKALLRLLRVLERAAPEHDDVTYLDFVPHPTSRGETADISARANWYLPQSARAIPIYCGKGSDDPYPADAAYMDPELVSPPGWSRHRPEGRRHVVLHRFTPRSTFEYLRALGNATVVSEGFAYGSDEAYFDLHRRFCRTRPPTPGESVARLLGLQEKGGTALVLATGPSASLLDERSIAASGVRITCNSAVRDSSLMEALQPDLIAFSDPVFHYGPSRYAASFRKDLLQALDETGALLLTSQLFVEPLLAHEPRLADRLVVLPLTSGGAWRWPTPDEPTVRITGNVLTNLMLPAAFSLADRVLIAGCDGREVSERYYWRHNPATQYSDGLMRTAFEAHTAFFRDRDYADYYERHCKQLEEFFVTAERAGKQVTGVTPSHIPALLDRGAPAFA